MIEEKFALVAVLIGFYLADCVVLLRPTQALGTIVIPWHIHRMLKPGRNSRGLAPGAEITLNFGMTFYPTRGYFPTFLNPLTPSIAAFRTTSLMPSLAGSKDSHPTARHRLIAARLHIRSLAPMIVMHALLLFGASRCISFLDGSSSCFSRSASMF